MTSLMEQRIREKGWNRPAKPYQPESFENAAAECSFLKGCEAYARQTIQLCLEQITNEKDYIESLERRRHKLEAMFIPVTKVKLVRIIQPSKTKAIANADDMTERELDEMIRLLEQLAEEGE